MFRDNLPLNTNIYVKDPDGQWQLFMKNEYSMSTVQVMRIVDGLNCALGIGAGIEMTRNREDNKMSSTSNTNLVRLCDGFYVDPSEIQSMRVSNQYGQIGIYIDYRGDGSNWYRVSNNISSMEEAYAKLDEMYQILEGRPSHE